MCFENSKENGLLVKAYSLGEKTGTGNFFNHAVAEHGISYTKEQNYKMTTWLQNTTRGASAATLFDLNRDIALWLCEDLQPFDRIEKPGFQAFNSKNLHLKLLSSRPVATTALVDVYSCLKDKIKQILLPSVSATVMMDRSLSSKSIIWNSFEHCNGKLGLRSGDLCSKASGVIHQRAWFYLSGRC